MLYITDSIEEFGTYAEDFVRHQDHTLEIASYGGTSICVECMDCNEVIFSLEYDPDLPYIPRSED